MSLFQKLLVVAVVSILSACAKPQIQQPTYIPQVVSGCPAGMTRYEQTNTCLTPAGFRTVEIQKKAVDLEIGMSTAESRTLMGKPEKVRPCNSLERCDNIWKYVSGTYAYEIRFKNDAVVGYGTSDNVR